MQPFFLDVKGFIGGRSDRKRRAGVAPFSSSRLWTTDFLCFPPAADFPLSFTNP